MAENHIIFIGGKPLMNYVTAVVMQFTTHDAKSVTIRSRGKFISRAVDVAEVVRSRFLRDQLNVDSILIGSEEFENKEGRKVRVSTIDLVLAAIGAEDADAAEKPAKASAKKTAKTPIAEEAPAEEAPVEEAPAV